MDEDKESLLTHEQKRIIAEYRKRTDGFSRNQKPHEKKQEKPEEREEKVSWATRNRPGIEKKIRQMIGTLLYRPKRHKQI